MNLSDDVSLAKLFVMMTSLGLVTRFSQVNNRLKTLKGRVSRFSVTNFYSSCQFAFKVLPEGLWEDIRLDYVNLCELLEAVDHELRFLLVLSNLNNLYFICFQLLNIYE